MNTLAPIPTEFSTLIAAREYELQHKIGAGKTAIDKIRVEVGAPVNDVVTVEGNDWRCPIRIIMANKTIIDQACGCDSYQALQLAMNELLVAHLQTITRTTPRTIPQAIPNGADKKLLLFGEECDL